MIKKILSVVLTLGMLLTLVSSLPVAAEGDVLPYIFEDFESIEDNAVAGPYGIGKALQTDGTYTMDLTGYEELLSSEVAVMCYIMAEEDTTVMIGDETFAEITAAGGWTRCTGEFSLTDELVITADVPFAIDDLEIAPSFIVIRPDEEEDFDLEAELIPVARLSHDFDINSDGITPVDADNVTIRHNEEGANSSENYVQLRHNNRNADTTDAVITVPVDAATKQYNIYTKVSFYAKSADANAEGASVKLSLVGESDVTFGGDCVKTNSNTATFTETLSRGDDAWTEFVAYYKRNYDGSIDTSNESFVLSFSKDGQRNNIDIDEIAVEDYYAPANMDFEEVLDAEPGDAIDTVCGWTTVNADVEATEDSYDGIAAKITATGATAGVSQKARFMADRKYTFSFYAKGEAGSIGKDVIFTADGVEFVCGELTAEWTEYTAIYRAVSEDEYAYPEISIGLNDADTDDVFYVDALTYDRDYNYMLGVIEDLDVTGDFVEEGAITVTYDAVIDADLEVTATVVQLFQVKGSANVLVASETTDAEEVVFELPENCADDEFIVTAICFSEAGMGVPESFTIDSVGAAATVSDNTIAFTPGVGAEATATITIANNRTTGDSVNAVLLVALFDENGALVNYGQLAIVVAAGEDASTVNLTVADAEGEATTAKAFVWDCGDSAAPTIFNSTMRELTPAF